MTDPISSNSVTSFVSPLMTLRKPAWSWGFVEISTPTRKLDMSLGNLQYVTALATIPNTAP